MDFAFIGLFIAMIGLIVKFSIEVFIFRKIHGVNVKKFLETKVLEKRTKINKSKTN